MDIEISDFHPIILRLLDEAIDARHTIVTISFTVVRTICNVDELPTVFRYRGVFFEKKINVETDTLDFTLSWIVFMNGCFDYLHIGHVSLIRSACEEYHGRVIIGLNSDRSYEYLRGCLPLFNQKDRKEMLLALCYVSSVHIFDDENQLRNMIRGIRPSVLVKGGDYKDKSVNGEEYVKSYGGEVRRDFYVPGFSSGSLKNKLLNHLIDRSCT